MTHESQSLPERQDAARSMLPNDSVERSDAGQRSTENNFPRNQAISPVWLPESVNLLSAGYRNPSDGTSPTFGRIDPTTRVLVPLFEAVKSGDADACTMALRALDRLPVRYRVTLGALSLMSLHDDDAALVVKATLRTAGLPLSDLVAPMQAARHWTGWASRRELKAYAAACFEALGPEDRAAFLRRYSRGVTG